MCILQLVAEPGQNKRKKTTKKNRKQTKEKIVYNYSKVMI